MFAPARFLALALATALVLASCSEDNTPVVTGNAQQLYADQKYFPLLGGTFQRYRVDTTGATGGTARDVARRTTRITGTRTFDSLTYTVQTIETVEGISTTFDTLFIRRDAAGVHASSPSLRSFRLPPQLPFNIDLPSEFLLIPDPLESTTSWSIFNFEFNQIPLIPIHVRISGTYAGLETVQTDFMTFKQCARIKVDLDIRLPNLQNPQDILNPTIIKESASFWFARPIGLIAADGSDVVFTLFLGHLPLNVPQRRIHQEVMGFDIIQPKGPCTAL